MLKTVLILKRETSNSVKIDTKMLPGLAGFLLKINVDIAHNIDRNIFVMQRDISSSYSQQQVDTFYSVASVGEMEWIPINDPDPNESNFFRIDSIELMFESKKDLEDSWKKISSEVFTLAESNDLSINTEPDLIASYPPDATSLYYGETIDLPDESDILNLSTIEFYSDGFNKVDTFSGENYFTVAVPIYTSNKNIFIDNVLALSNQNDITLVNKYGASIVYKIYTTKEKISSGTHIITFK
jgi:hypothetical protein